MSSLTVKYFLQVPIGTLDNNKGDLDRITAALKESISAQWVDWPLELIGQASDAIRVSGGKVTLTAEPFNGGLRVASIEAGNTSASHYGLAVDLGTTVVAAELISLTDGQSLTSTSEVNGQVRFGDDLLTRLHFAAQGGVGKLQAGLVDTVNKLVTVLCAETGITSSQISAVCAAGNTSMTHLFLGLDPSPIRREPYAPALNHAPRIRAKDIRLAVLPNAPVYLFPSAGSFLGGDLVAGALASGIANSDEISLLLDIGTNGEMILGNRDWLLAGAGAAGPALEGAVAECAKRAETGAIDRVSIDPGTLEPEFSTIGGKSPTGLCGSGLIDTIAELYKCGLIDVAGRFVLDKKTNRWQKINNRYTYLLAEPDKSYDRPAVYITEKDIQNVLRTKAAMVAALTVLLDSVGITVSDILNIYTAGSFGIHLSVDSATRIGLYPRIPAERFISLGNGSLRGTREILLNMSKIEEAQRISDRITYLELNIHPRFMGIFRSSKYI